MADSGKLSFVELMEKQPLYGPLMDKPVIYQLTALYNGRYWSLAIKGDQPDLPYVTVELILSDDGKTQSKTIVRAVRLVDYKEDELHLLNPKPVGTYGPDKTLRELCRLGDETFEEVCNKKWQEFTTTHLAKLDILVQLPTTTTKYYTIEVDYTSGYQECYLGTQFNDMRFPTEFRDGNISVYWNCNPDDDPTYVRNAVTERGQDTYMETGPAITGKAYRVNLTGSEQAFHFMNSRNTLNVYAIATTVMSHGEETVTFLMPQHSGEIVAMAGVEHPVLFRVSPLKAHPSERVE